MGLINSALQVGRSALLSYQSALQVIGNNISNAGSPDYTRQSPRLSSVNGPQLPEGMRPGAGVALTSLQRHLDEALEDRIRNATGQTESALAERQNLGLVETLFDPLTGMQIQERLTEFFNSMDQVQNLPEDNATRELAIDSAATLARSLRTLRSSLVELGFSFNEQIGGVVEQANALAGKIGELNTEIVTTEAAGAPASALRDQRDAHLRSLSELVGISARLQPNGAINVYIGNEVLVDGGVSRGFKIITDVNGEFERDSIAFADNSGRVLLQGGRLEGIIRAREEQAFGRVQDVDQLAAALIAEVNQRHSDGQGLAGFTQLTSTQAVADPNASLRNGETGLALSPVNGSLFVAVHDIASGASTVHQINVDLDGLGNDDTTLSSLVDDINASVDGLTASVTADNRLSLEADSGMSFTFGHDGQTQRQDTSGTLAALGLNTLFSGTSAVDIEVNPMVATDPSMLAAASVPLSGDGVNAGRLASVGDTPVEALDGRTILEGYMTIANDVAVASAAARESGDVSESVLTSLRAQKENISGVSLDEEAVQLLKFERAFQGAARFVSVVDRLSNEIVALVR